MKQLELFEERGIQLRERLATPDTGLCIWGGNEPYEARGRELLGYNGSEGIEPERTNVPKSEAVHLAEDRTLSPERRRGEKGLAGSEAVARQQRDKAGNLGAPGYSPDLRVCSSKPIDSKQLQRIHWESDQLIVVRKEGNSCGAKGLAVMFWDGRGTSSTLRGGKRKSTRLSSLSVLAKDNPQMRFTSLAHLLTLEFFKECFRELKRDSASGIDGAIVEEYEAQLERTLRSLVERLKAKRYRPQPVRRVWIPKPKGGRRPLEEYQQLRIRLYRWH